MLSKQVLCHPVKPLTVLGFEDLPLAPMGYMMGLQFGEDKFDVILPAPVVLQVQFVTVFACPAYYLERV